MSRKYEIENDLDYRCFLTGKIYVLSQDIYENDDSHIAKWLEKWRGISELENKLEEILDLWHAIPD